MIKRSLKFEFRMRGVLGTFLKIDSRLPKIILQSDAKCRSHFYSMCRTLKEIWKATLFGKARLHQKGILISD